jgi:hypothetical protein
LKQKLIASEICGLRKYITGVISRISVAVLPVCLEFMQIVNSGTVFVAWWSHSLQVCKMHVVACLRIKTFSFNTRSVVAYYECS